jgi:hypothetical protein
MAGFWAFLRRPEGTLAAIAVTAVLVGCGVLVSVDPGKGPQSLVFTGDETNDRVVASTVPLASSWDELELRVAQGAPPLRVALGAAATNQSTVVTGPIHPTGLLAQGAFVDFCGNGASGLATVVVVPRSASPTASAGAALFTFRFEVTPC